MIKSVNIKPLCKDLGMECMNNAIKYLCKTCSFVKGEEI